MSADAFSRQRITDVERRASLSTEEFKAEFLGVKPVVLTGSTRAWPAMDKWSLPFFRERFGETQVVARQYLDDGRSFIRQAIERKRRVKLSQWIDFLEGDDAVLQGERFTWSLRESKELLLLHRELRRDARFDELFPELGARFDYFLWFGPGGYVTGLHTDMIELNLLFHVVGRKEMRLYAPDQTPCMYADVVVQGGLYSAVNAYRPDLERHPRFADAVGQRAALEPGDLCYVPRDWWHMVRSHDVTISLTASCERLP